MYKRQLFEMLFQAAGLIIDTLRTFFLIVLSILGPLAVSYTHLGEATWKN